MTSRHSARKLPLAAALTMVVVAALCLLGGGAFATWGYLTQQSAQQDHATALHDQHVHKQEEDARLAAEKAADEAHTRQVLAQEEFTEQMIDQGFYPSEDDPTVFWKPIDGECSYLMPCTWLGVVTMNDCPRGVYVAANIEVSGVVVANGNDITGALAAGKAATAQINFPGLGSSDGESSITSARCL